MSATVVYESVYGNTRAIAEAIAESLGDAEVVPVHEAADRMFDTAAFDTRADKSPLAHGRRFARDRQALAPSRV